MKQEKFTVAEAQEMSVRISYSTGTSAELRADGGLSPRRQDRLYD